MQRRQEVQTKPRRCSDGLRKDEDYVSGFKNDNRTLRKISADFNYVACNSVGNR